MDLLSYLDQKAKESPPKWDDLAMLVLRKTITPELQKELEAHIVDWLKQKGLNSIVISIISGILDIPEPK